MHGGGAPIGRSLATGGNHRWVAQIGAEGAVEGVGKLVLTVGLSEQVVGVPLFGEGPCTGVGQFRPRGVSASTADTTRTVSTDCVDS